jgi:ubiquinone/menaquinone biosynthesis C-methylase UbiE
VNGPNTDAEHPYYLGHSDRELYRLSEQARLIGPITRGFLRDAGIVPGMRVLDVGSGIGDVAFLAAEIVGVQGEVVGVDRAQAAIAVARTRAKTLSLPNVSFHLGDPTEMEFERPFDAVIGRYVLTFQPDPAMMLRRLATHIRPGGCIVFHELDFNGLESFPPAPLYDRCCRLFLDTIRSMGSRTRFGMDLYATFTAAGLPAPSMRLEALIGGGPNSAGPAALVANVLSSQAANMERLGIATAAELDLDTLAERMVDDAIANNSVLVARSEIGAWTTRS